jgi:hypothetical protein
VYERPDGLYEIGFKDPEGRQRQRGPFETITAARTGRAKAVGNAADGTPVAADPRLTFGRAADAWMEAYVAGLRPATREVAVADAVRAGRHHRLSGSELLGLWWENLDLSDIATATIRFATSCATQTRT